MFSTKGRLYLPMALIIFGALPAMSAEPILQPAANLWSEPANGLSGRLRVEFEDLKPGLRYAVYLELRNHALTPVAVINQPEINAELLDPAAKPVSASGFPISGPIPNPQWAVIPGMPALLFASTCKMWAFRPGKMEWFSSLSAKPGALRPETIG